MLGIFTKQSQQYNHKKTQKRTNTVSQQKQGKHTINTDEDTSKPISAAPRQTALTPCGVRPAAPYGGGEDTGGGGKDTGDGLRYGLSIKWRGRKVIETLYKLK